MQATLQPEPAKDENLDRQALYHSRQMYLWLDAEGRLEDANPAFVAHVNAPVEGLRGLPLLEFIHPGSRPAFEQAFARVKQTRCAVACVPLTSIQAQSYEIDLKPISAPPALHVLVEIRSADAAAQRHLAADPDQLRRRLLDEGDETLYWMDTQGVVLYINNAVKQFGLDAQAVIGKHWSTFISPEDHFVVQNAFQRLSNGFSETISVRIVDDHGRSHPVSVLCHPIMEDGRLVSSRGAILPMIDAAKVSLMFERRAAQLALLNRIGEVIASTRDLEQILENTVRLLHRGFGYYHVAFFLPQEDKTLRMTARAGVFANRYPPDYRLAWGQGIVGWVAEQQKSALVNDVRRDLRYVNPFPDRIPTNAELAMPIVAEGRLYGVIDLQSPLVNAFEENDARVIETVARQLALAMVNARLYEEVRQRLSRQEYAEALLRLQRDVLVDLTSIHDFENVLQVVIGKLTQIEGVDCGSIYLIDEEGALDMVASSGLTSAFSAAVSYLPPESNKARAIREGKPIYSRYQDLPYDPRIPADARRQENILTLVAYPIQYRSRIIADLTLGSHTRYDIPEATRDLIESVASDLGATIARIKIEKELSASEAQSRALLEALPDLFFICDSYGRFLNYRQAPGYGLYARPEEFIGKTMHDVLPKEVADPALEAIRNALASKQAQEFDYRLHSAQKQEDEFFEARVSAASEDVAIIIIRNINERVRAQRDIESREKKYRALFDLNQDGVMLLDTQGRYIDLNQRAQELTGYSREELLARSFHQLVTPEELEQARQRFAVLLTGGPMPVYERSLVRKDGVVVTFEFNSARVDDAQGNPIYIQTLIRDISQRKRLEEHQRRVYQLEKALAEISTASLKTGSIDAYIPWVVERAAFALDGIRGYIFDVLLDSGAIRKSFEWLSPGLPSRTGQYDDFDVNDLALLYKGFLDNRPFIAPGEGATPHQHELDAIGMSAVISMPIFVQNRLYGVLSVEGKPTRREWLAEEISFTRSVCEILGRGIERSQSASSA